MWSRSVDAGSLLALSITLCAVIIFRYDCSEDFGNRKMCHAVGIEQFAKRLWHFTLWYKRFKMDYGHLNNCFSPYSKSKKAVILLVCAHKSGFINIVYQTALIVYNTSHTVKCSVGAASRNIFHFTALLTIVRSPSSVSSQWNTPVIPCRAQSNVVMRV